MSRREEELRARKIQSGWQRGRWEGKNRKKRKKTGRQRDGLQTDPKQGEGGVRSEMWASKPGQVPASHQASLDQPGPKGPVLYQSCPSMAR